jgi:hypothetical protein
MFGRSNPIDYGCERWLAGYEGYGMGSIIAVIKMRLKCQI